MHRANSSAWEVTPTEVAEPPVEPDDVVVVVEPDECDADEFDDCEVDEPGEPEPACGDPPPHAATPQAMATRTAASGVPRHARRLLVDLRWTVRAVSWVFM